MFSLANRFLYLGIVYILDALDYGISGRARRHGPDLSHIRKDLHFLNAFHLLTSGFQGARVQALFFF
jgi:hypothetical protein